MLHVILLPYAEPKRIALCAVVGDISACDRSLTRKAYKNSTTTKPLIMPYAKYFVGEKASEVAKASLSSTEYV